MASTLRDYFSQKYIDYTVFLNGDKNRNRSKDVLLKMSRLKVITYALQHLMPTLPIEEKGKLFNESVYKLAHITAPNIEHLFYLNFPQQAPYIIFE